MTQTPYTPRDPFAAEQVVGDQRVSGLAIGSFVTSLLCCIPGVGAIAAVLGIGALVSIGRSGGRLTGRALAFMAIVLGLLGTMGYIGLAIVLSQLGAIMQPYYGTLAAIESGDTVAARRQMSGQVAAAITDERLAEFKEEYRQVHGSFQQFPQGFIGLLQGYVSLGARMQLVDEAERVYPGKGVWPMPARFDNGEALVVFVVEDSGGGAPQIINIGVEGSGQPFIWLKDPSGPAGQPPTPPSGPP